MQELLAMAAQRHSTVAAHPAAARPAARHHQSRSSPPACACEVSVRHTNGIWMLAVVGTDPGLRGMKGMARRVLGVTAPPTEGGAGLAPSGPRIAQPVL